MSKLTIMLLALLPAIAQGGAINYAWQYGYSDYPPAVPAPATAQWGFTGDGVPPAIITVTDTMPNSVWDGTDWTGEGEHLISIDEAVAGQYGLDWAALEAAMTSSDNSNYTQSLFSLGDAQDVQPWHPANLADYTASSVTIRLRYLGTTNGASLPPSVRAFVATVSVAGTGTQVINPEMPEPHSVWLLFVGLVTACGGRGRICPA